MDRVRWILHRIRRIDVLEEEIREWRELYPGQQTDLERVLAYSHRKHYLGLRGGDEIFAHSSLSIHWARKTIQEILIEETPKVATSLYANFAHKLSPHDVVLTFNYDTLLEQVLDSIGKSYTLTPEWWLNRESPGQKFVDLLKLHGSVDWYDRYYHDDVRQWYAEEEYDVPDKDPIFGPTPSIPSEPLSRGQTLEGAGSRILKRIYRVPNHSQYFPIQEGRYIDLVPCILPPAYDKLLGNDAIRDLWESLHRTLDSFSSIIVIGYSMPQYDSYAYEALGKLFIDYQKGGNKTYWEQRRVPIQLVTLADSKQHALLTMPFLNPDKSRVWYQGFSQESLDWIDWGDGDLS